MSDLISRQAAIDTEGLDEQIRCEMCRNPMHTDRGCDGNCRYDEKLYERIMQILDERIKPLPSAQPQRMRGEWIDVTKTGGAELWKCSECGELELEDSYFCPNCGADMRGEQDDENRSNSNAQTDTRARGMGATDKSSGI